MTELETCSYCNGPAVLETLTRNYKTNNYENYEFKEYRAACHACNWSTEWRDDEKSAIELWNGGTANDKT
jgi:Restriction alleviation protein Lar